MANTYFQFKQFRIDQADSGMKVTTDACLFGAWVAEMERENTIKNVLDVGTGTGLLTLMLAQQMNARFDALEIDEATYLEASRNFAASKWAATIHVSYQSIQTFLTESRYDVIVCNPPFFTGNLTGTNAERNLAIHNESLSAQDLAAALAKHLTPTGNAYVLYPKFEMKQFMSMAEKLALYPSSLVSVLDREGEDVLRVMGCFGREKVETEICQVIIKNEAAYSNDFVLLLKDYYLNL